jgi:hypothetical protein
VSGTQVNYLSLTTSRLRLYCNKQFQGPATGFFYRKDGVLFLVSNWHVFAGRDPSDGQPLHSSCFPPDEIAFTFCKQGSSGIEWQWQTFQVSNDDGIADWWQHPELGQKVDVAVARIPNELESLQEFSAETPGSQIQLRAGQDVFVLGYPSGITKQGFVPLWKRASIASEPGHDTDDGKVILIDTATREGMSGSPVLAIDSTNYFQNLGNRFERASARKLVGVYSSRYGTEDLSKIQIGICWKVELIDEIIAGNCPGSYELIAKQ